MYFFVCTNYHILVALVARCHFNDEKNKILIISDRITDAEIIYDRIIAEGLWDRVILFRSKSLEFKEELSRPRKILNLIALKCRVERFIRKEKIEKICTFTVGDQTANFFSASKVPGETYLCEDGTFPYYAGIEMYDHASVRPDFVKKNNKEGVGLSLTDSFKFFLDDMFLSGYIIRAGTWFNSVFLLIDGLYNASYDSFPHAIKPLKCDMASTDIAFTAASRIFNYKANDFYKNVDVVFVDSGMVSTDYLSMEDQVDYSFKLLARFGEKNIAWKLGPYCDQKKVDYIRTLIVGNDNLSLELENKSVPWEVIFFNNKESLSQANVTTYMSTAAFSPLLFFGIKTDVTILSKLVSKHKKMSPLYQLLHYRYCSFADSIRNYYPDNIIDIPES